MSPDQQVWTACWSGLVHSGWDSLRCAWHLHSWAKKTLRTRNWVFVAKELKGLAHYVRAASLQSDLPELPSIRKDVVQAFGRLAEKHPPSGFAFSRLSRALPRPPADEVREACKRAKAMSRDWEPASVHVVDDIRRFVSSNTRGRRVRPPHAFPSSSSSCFEWPATRGGIDGYLFALGCACESGVSDHPEIRRVVEDRLTREDLKRYAQDSIGRYALHNAGIVIAYFDSPATVDIRLAYRCAGFLALRRFRALNGAIPESRMEAIASPGMKVRVVGVPDALTFIEGDWVRRSCQLLPREHWTVTTGPAGQPTELTARGGDFVSVDLTSATDGLLHDVVKAVVEGLKGSGCIRSSDYPLVLRGLGLEPQTKWHLGDDTWLAERGSPMGTPLSFVVLSWVNAWCTHAFTRARIHGDDAVGVAYAAFEAVEYRDAVQAVGASVNMRKTFTSSSAWTMCEVAAWPRSKQRFGRAVFVPPPCPPPGLCAPVAAESRCGNRFLRRQERVMKTLFPWCARDPRLRLPVEVGGLGYTGRGLAVPASVRRRLGALVSRGVEPGVRGVVSKAPFREAGLYPRPLIPVPSQPRQYHLARKLVAQEPLEDPCGVPVSLREFVIYQATLVESQYRLLVGDKFKRRRDAGRPERTKTKALFKPPTVPLRVKPLSVSHGVGSLRRWASKLASSEVRVFEDVALEIRGRTPNSAQT